MSVSDSEHPSATKPEATVGKNLALQREEFEKAGEYLKIENFDDNPFVQFSHWYQDAEQRCTGYPNPVTLSTVDENGYPDSRTVLLKGFDQQGFVFYSNYQSKKAQQMAGNPHVCLQFFWEALERQVIIRGRVNKISEQESDDYFATRPRGSQIGAWASKQSETVSSRDILQTQLQSIEQKFHNQPVTRPDFWGGYRVEPQTIEFWQGQPSRLHDRFFYQKTATGWTIVRLSP